MMDELMVDDDGWILVALLLDGDVGSSMVVRRGTTRMNGIESALTYKDKPNLLLTRIAVIATTRQLLRSKHCVLVTISKRKCAETKIVCAEMMTALIRNFLFYFIKPLHPCH